jgi:membrane protein
MKSTDGRPPTINRFRHALRSAFSKTTFKAIIELYRAAIDGWNHDKAPRLAAALAFYATFSLAPLIVIVIWFAGLLFGQAAAQSYLVEQLHAIIGPRVAQFVQNLLETARQTPSGPLASLIALASLLFGASGLFFQITDSLNTMWNLPPTPWRGFKGLIIERVPSILMVLAAGFLLIAALVASTVLATLDRWLSSISPELVANLGLVNFVASFTVIMLVFAVIYKTVPDTPIAWRDVWLGAITASLLFAIGKSLLSLYLSFSTVTTVYGAAGSFVAVLIWIYYSAQIFLFGSEVCQVYAKRYGSRATPPAS